MELRLANKSDFKKVKKLYKTAFPADERAPFSALKKRAKDGRARLYIAIKDGAFCGFAYIVSHGDVAYLFYFAVEKHLRGGGIGAETLSAVKEIYNDKILFLAREQLDETADNYDMRVRRRNFYVRNGFTDIPRTIVEGKVRYDVMSIGGDVSPEQYLSLMKAFGGNGVYKRVDMLITDND